MSANPQFSMAVLRTEGASVVSGQVVPTTNYMTVDYRASNFGDPGDCFFRVKCGSIILSEKKYYVVTDTSPDSGDQIVSGIKFLASKLGVGSKYITLECGPVGGSVTDTVRLPSSGYFTVGVPAYGHIHVEAIKEGGEAVEPFIKVLQSGSTKASGYGVVDADLPVGKYSVSSAPMTRYVTPASQAVTIYEDKTTNVTMVYVPDMVRVDIRVLPLDIREFAEIFVNGVSVGFGQQSVYIEEIGTYTISFGPVQGYPTPDDVVLQVTEITGGILAVEGKYEDTELTMTLTTFPVDGDIYVDGVLVGNGEYIAVVEPGTYKLSYGAVEGYRTPADTTIEIQAGHVNKMIGIYEAILEPPAGMGVLTVVTSPVVGVIYLDGEYLGVGSVSGEIDPGEYIISFGEVDGYITPKDIAVSIGADQVIKKTGTYVEEGTIPPVAEAGFNWLGVVIGVGMLVGVVWATRGNKVRKF